MTTFHFKPSGHTPLFPCQKINVDNKVRFGYLNCYWFRLFDASICGSAAEAIHNSAFSILQLQKGSFFSLSFGT